MIILVDLDGTICDWNGWFNKHKTDLFDKDLASRLPDAASTRSFDLFAGLDLEEASAVAHIFNYEGFYAGIPPIPGAVEAVKEMISENIDVFFVTSPWYTNTTCMQDKADWIKKYFGDEGLSRLVITKDKTAVRGDILIDDKPVITGALTPTWAHILYNQPYNTEILKPRILDWKDWRSIVTIVREELFV